MLARTAHTAAQQWGAALGVTASRRSASAAAGLTSNQYPPPDPSRLGTADLCDVYHPEAVDVVSQPKIQIMQPLFKDLGDHLRFRGQAATIKCFEVLSWWRVLPIHEDMPSCKHCCGLCLQVL